MEYEHSTLKGWYESNPAMSDKQKLALAKKHGYFICKIIGPQHALVALHDFVYTRGISFIHPIDGGIIRRYCYENRGEATLRYLAYENPEVHPGGYWIKHKGHFAGRYVDDFNPDYR